MSDCPRTDAELRRLRGLVQGDEKWNADDVAAFLRLARSLERSLTLATRRLEVAVGTLRDVRRRWLENPSGVDMEADENNTSPEDMSSHCGGLAVKAIDAALKRIAEMKEGE